MGKTKFLSPFPPLLLPLDDVAKLEHLADVFVRKNVSQYEAFIQQQQAVDERLWKLVKQREAVRVYAERSNSGISTRSSIMSEDKGESTEQQQQPSTQQLPVMLVVGSVVGTLDDMMYGVVNHTLQAMRLKTSYVDDNVSDAAVLATLATPTYESPFQSLTIKWMENEQALVFKPLVRNRDFVYMETTGITQTSSGERIGFHLLHSVHFPQTCELEGRVRGNMSVCGIYREKPGSPNEVDVYVKGILNPGGNIMRAVVVSASADALVSAWRNVECAHMKKLAWKLRTVRRSFSSASTSGGEQDTTTRDNNEELSASSRLRSRKASDVGCCATCDKAPSSLSRSMLGDVRKRKCNLCWKYVCSSCRVKKTLSHVSAPTSKLRQREFAFCAKCISDAVATSAFSIAQREFVASGDPFAAGSDLFSTNQSERFLVGAESVSEQTIRRSTRWPRASSRHEGRPVRAV
ncbi:hypothetical protein Gpo141_00003867 [Globisporangium polare]